jgi:alpha-D-ribose 1-methylphosphonate 5-triphosphate synthase subunit PhnI
MYATLEQTPALTAARALAEASAAEVAGLRFLEQQVCAESGLWAPDAARRALAQAQGDVPRAVALVRVWAAALPEAPAMTVDPADVRITRRVSAAYAEVPGGQWLGAAPELASRLLQWDDESTPGEAVDLESTPDAADAFPPSRVDCPRVRDLLADLPVVPAPQDGDGADPARTVLRPPLDRASRLAVHARGETASLVALAALVLGRRREAVLAELTTSVVLVRTFHPRTGAPVVVAEVPVVEADAIVDADIEGRAAFAIGWGASIGETDRRAIALALLDGAVQADGGSTPLMLDEQTITAAVDGSATNGFVEHLRLPHYASFAAYVDQARTPAPTGEVVT